jgi:primosomal protein N' (replication factor Y)
MQIASVVFNSPLPQLDKPFDYLVPDELQDLVSFGVKVIVPFGSAKRPKTGIVIAIQETSVHEGKLSEIAEIVSSLPILTLPQYELCQAVAQRQMGQIGELLGTAVPKRSVRAEALYVKNHAPIVNKASELSRNPKRTFVTPATLDADVNMHWKTLIIKKAEAIIKTGRSVLVVLPDFRELAAFEGGLAASDLAEHAVRQSSEDSLKDRWTNHLRAANQSGVIVYGTRLASFAPCNELSTIFLVDDGDESHQEQSSPYWHSREVLLQRSLLENCDIEIISHSPSAEISRLCEIGYLERLVIPSAKPLVRITNDVERIDQETYALISKTLSESKPVLIQIANLGFASALACVSCKEVRRCGSCHGTLWLDPSKIARCRNCKQTYSDKCSCGGTAVRPISLGSNALAEQLQRSFPKAAIVHSSGSERITQIESAGTLVIATPGAEPSVAGGFKLVILADSLTMIGVPRLRGLEQACQKWANAISKTAIDGMVVIVGLSGTLADQLRELNFDAVIRDDMLERAELGLPPSTRVLSVHAANINDLNRLRETIAEQLEELTPIHTTVANTIVYGYAIASGSTVAAKLKTLVSSVSRKSKDKLPGQRVLFVNMDDHKVI